MTDNNNLTAKPFPPLAKRMLIGASIGLVLIAAFLFSAGEPNPAWPTFWMIKPLIMVPLAGSCGGLFYHLMDPIRNKGGWKKILINAFSVLVYIIGLWLGTVLGLNGTMWN
jgi:hypothetical protein